jgi:crotonobetainyl-CoA:carnitine CoA-transferase CaiB-like acyl-CoA transferase
MVDWMVGEEAAPAWLDAIDFTDWTTARYMDSDLAEDFIELTRRVEEPVQAFLAKKTKKELYHGALERRILLAPVSTAKDIAEDEQLAAREFFRTVRHDGVGTEVPVLGRFARLSATCAGEVGPAPTLGQHNLDVYQGLLGVGLERLRFLYATGVI